MDNIVDMTDASPVVKNKGGRPKKVGATDKADFIPLPSGPKKVRERNQNQGAVLDLPKWLVDVLWANQISLQWIATSVRGDEQVVRTMVQGYRQGGAWEPVTTDMFPYQGKPIFKGMFYGPEYIGQIEVGGQVLHWRPRKLTEEALAEMGKEAASPLEATRRNMREGIIEGTNGAVDTRSQAARAWNKIEETIEPPSHIPMPD